MSSPYEFFVPDSWGDVEGQLYADAMSVDMDALEDNVAQTLFHVGYFDQDVDTDTRMSARQNLSAYLEQEYGVTFEDVFDWETFRANYG